MTLSSGWRHLSKGTSEVQGERRNLLISTLHHDPNIRLLIKQQITFHIISDKRIVHLCLLAPWYSAIIPYSTPWNQAKDQTPNSWSFYTFPFCSHFTSSLANTHFLPLAPRKVTSQPLLGVVKPSPKYLVQSPPTRSVLGTGE